jgi:hypothetical protein
MRAVRLLLLGVVPLIALLAAPSAFAGPKAKTLTADVTSVERSWTDENAPGRSVGDQFVLSSTLTTGGKDIGHWVLACTIVDLDIDGSVAGLCSSSATLHGKGEVTASGMSTLVADPSGRSPFGVTIGPKEDFAITGGTGSYRGAHGEITSAAAGTGRTLTLRYWLG